MASILLRRATCFLFHFWGWPAYWIPEPERGDQVNTPDSGKMVGFVSIQDQDKARAFFSQANWD
jgi:hypothetical protein